MTRDERLSALNAASRALEIEQEKLGALDDATNRQLELISEIDDALRTIRVVAGAIEDSDEEAERRCSSCKHFDMPEGDEPCASCCSECLTNYAHAGARHEEG